MSVATTSVVKVSAIVLGLATVGFAMSWQDEPLDVGVGHLLPYDGKVPHNFVSIEPPPVAALEAVLIGALPGSPEASLAIFGDEGTCGIAHCVFSLPFSSEGVTDDYKSLLPHLREHVDSLDPELQVDEALVGMHALHILGTDTEYFLSHLPSVENLGEVSAHAIAATQVLGYVDNDAALEAAEELVCKLSKQEPELSSLETGLWGALNRLTYASDARARYSKLTTTEERVHWLALPLTRGVGLNRFDGWEWGSTLAPIAVSSGIELRALSISDPVAVAELVASLDVRDFEVDVSIAVATRSDALAEIWNYHARRVLAGYVGPECNASLENLLSAQVVPAGVDG